MGSITIKGNLVLRTRDAITKEILEESAGDNLILNTGLEDLCYLLSGNITIPTDLVAGNTLSNSIQATTHFPMYCQFGTSSTPPTPRDASIYENGTLDPNAVSPTGASDILKASYFYPGINQVTLVFTLNPNQGNGTGQVEGVTYREAVLMSKTSFSPVRYRWFARKVFADRIKKIDTILEAEWTLTFIASAD